MLFEINATYRCNQQCEFCNRAIGVLPLSQSDVSAEQVERFCKATEHLQITRLKIAGGEPTLNRELPDIIEILNRAEHVRKVWVMTNGIREERVPGARYVTSPPDSKTHVPFLISPWDFGIQNNGRMRCVEMHVCGHAFDRWGFIVCPVETILATVLRRKVQSSEPRTEPRPDICRHCIYSVPRWVRLAMAREVAQRPDFHPSKTFRKGLARHQEAPFRLDPF